MKSEKQNKEKNRVIKLSLLLLLLLLLSFTVGPFFISQAGVSIEESAMSELEITNEQPQVSPLESSNGSEAFVSDNLFPVPGQQSGPLTTGELQEESTAGVVPLDFALFPVADEIEVAVIEEQPEGEEPAEPGSEESQADEPAENSEEESQDPDLGEDNLPSEELPEEVIRSSAVYNFGNSEQFDLEQNVSQVEFEEAFVVKGNTWQVADDGSGLSAEKNSEGRIFTPNSHSDYFVKIVAALGPSSTERQSGGIGVMFETSLDQNNNDSGYILQFDRGYSQGELIIRSRDIWPNSNGQPQTYESSVLSRYYDRSILPAKSENPEWWAAEHQLEMRVANINVAGESNQEDTNRQLSVYLDNEHLFDWDFASSIEEGDENHVGLRVWHDVPETKIVSLEIGELAQEQEQVEETLSEVVSTSDSTEPTPELAEPSESGQKEELDSSGDDVASDDASQEQQQQ